MIEASMLATIELVSDSTSATVAAMVSNVSCEHTILTTFQYTYYYNMQYEFHNNGKIVTIPS